jgi:hypothetical protein
VEVNSVDSHLSGQLELFPQLFGNFINNFMRILLIILFNDLLNLVLKLVKSVLMIDFLFSDEFDFFHLSSIILVIFIFLMEFAI